MKKSVKKNNLLFKLLNFMEKPGGKDKIIYSVFGFVFLLIVLITDFIGFNLLLWLLFVLLIISFITYRLLKSRSFDIQTEDMYSKTVQLIKNFKPKYKYRKEDPYQEELWEYLRSHLGASNVEMEKQIGSSRADIAVGGHQVGIEVKGPTKTHDLQTIADKCQRYEQHFETVVVVLFDVNIMDRRYDEWLKGHIRFHPNIPIIRIDKVINQHLPRKESRTEVTTNDQWVLKKKIK